MSAEQVTCDRLSSGDNPRYRANRASRAWAASPRIFGGQSRSQSSCRSRFSSRLDSTRGFELGRRRIFAGPNGLIAALSPIA